MSHVDVYEDQKFYFDEYNMEISYFYSQELPKGATKNFAYMKVKCDPQDQDQNCHIDYWNGST